MALTSLEIIGSYGQEGHNENLLDGMSVFIAYAYTSGRQRVDTWGEQGKSVVSHKLYIDQLLNNNLESTEQQPVLVPPFEHSGLKSLDKT